MPGEPDVGAIVSIGATRLQQLGYPARRQHFVSLVTAVVGEHLPYPEPVPLLGDEAAIDVCVPVLAIEPERGVCGPDAAPDGLGEKLRITLVSCHGDDMREQLRIGALVAPALAGLRSER